MSIRVFFVHASELTWDDVETLGTLSRSGSVAVKGIIRPTDGKPYLRVDVIRDVPSIWAIKAFKPTRYNSEWTARTPQSNEIQSFQKVLT